MIRQFAHSVLAFSSQLDASKVLTFSSEFDATSFAASHLPGPPRVYPRYGGHAGAWVTGGGDRRPWVELAFPRAVAVTAVRVWETCGAGGVTAIKARPLDADAAPGGSGGWVTLWRRPGGRGELIPESRIFCPALQRRCRATELRVEMKSKVDGYIMCRGIDAVEVEGEP